MLDIPQPPAIYQNYRGPITIKILPPPAVEAECLRQGVPAPKFKGQHILACTMPPHDGQPCLILMPPLTLYPHEDYVFLLRHEKGHCAGWVD